MTSMTEPPLSATSSVEYLVSDPHVHVGSVSKVDVCQGRYGHGTKSSQSQIGAGTGTGTGTGAAAALGAVIKDMQARDQRDRRRGDRV